MTIQTITTTELRTKAAKLVKILRAGHSVELIHRSNNLGTLTLSQNKPAKPFDAEGYLRATKHLPKTPQTSDKERERAYREYIESKYGKSVS